LISICEAHYYFQCGLKHCHILVWISAQVEALVLTSTHVHLFIGKDSSKMLALQLW